MTNKELVKKYESVQAKSSKLVNWFCLNGMGNLKPSDMRMMSEKPKQVIQYLELLNILCELKLEAQRRYGPDFNTIRDLLK